MGDSRVHRGDYGSEMETGWFWGDVGNQGVVGGEAFNEVYVGVGKLEVEVSTGETGEECPEGDGVGVVEGRVPGGDDGVFGNSDEEGDQGPVDRKGRVGVRAGGLLLWGIGVRACGLWWSNVGIRRGVLWCGRVGFRAGGLL